MGLISYGIFGGGGGGGTLADSSIFEVHPLGGIERSPRVIFTRDVYVYM